MNQSPITLEALLEKLKMTKPGWEDYFRRLEIVEELGKLGDHRALPALEEIVRTDTQKFDAWGLDVAISMAEFAQSAIEKIQTHPLLARLSEQIDKTGVRGRQCFAAICLYRYCQTKSITHPLIDQYIEHLWRIARIDSPQEFGKWEAAFWDIGITGLGDPLPEDVIQAISPDLRDEVHHLIQDVMETSAATWYGSDLPGSKKHLLKVIHTVTLAGVEIPSIEPFYLSSPETHGGSGRPLSVEEIEEWRRLI